MSSVKKSFGWSFIEQLGPRLMQFAVSIWLARVLDPKDFGLVAMLALFMALAQTFADSGLSASLIQKKEISKDDETSVFVINVGLGLFMALLLCAISPLVAWFFDYSILIPLLCVQSVSVLFSSFVIVQKALIIRNMAFKKLAVVGLVSTLISGGIAVVLAYQGFGVWSLIGLTVTQSMVQMVLLWTNSSWRPIGRVRLSNVRQIWDFSSYLLYSQLIGIAFQHIYSTVIGKLYSAGSLGFYNRANTLRMIPAGVMTGIINKVAFPMFSRLQDDRPRLLGKMRELVRISLIFSASGMALLALVADLLIPLLMTEKWLPSVPLLRILCFATILYPLSSLYLVALQSMGLSKLTFRLEVIKLVLSVFVIFAACWHGIEILAWTVVVLTVIAYFINVWHHVKMVGYRWRDQAYDILPTFILCGLAAFLAWKFGNPEIGSSIVVMIWRSAVFLSVVFSGVLLTRETYFNDLWRHGCMAIQSAGERWKQSRGC